MRAVRVCGAVFASVVLFGACQRTPAAGDSATATPDAALSSRASSKKTPPPPDLAYVCPMDPDIRSTGPGKCPRCGMALVAGVPDQTEYHVDLTVAPTPIQPNQPAHLTFEIHDPWKDRPVEKFSLVHEKLFHMFIVSRDLQFFAHEHPTWNNGAFHYDATFPKPGMYRIISDFYPEAAAPQLLTETVFVAGTEAPVQPLARDYSPKQSNNLKVEMITSPPEPVAGVTAQLRFTVTPDDGLEKYLGAWGHMLVASDDLIDAIHTHPFIADGSAQMQFSLVFPRPRMYRIWVQFQRKGVVNIAHFDVDVASTTTPARPPQ